jgi:hypothetical protein
MASVCPVAPDPSADRPHFSVVICTRNRARLLDACLERVAGLAYEGPWEIVLVDNGSTDDTADVVRRFAARAPVPVAVVEERRRGLGAARNAGVAASRGDSLAFTDDDCYPAPDWLSQARRVMAAHPDAGVVGGRILLHDPTDAPYTIQLDPEPRRMAAPSFIAPGSVQGANLVVRRTVFAAVGGFDNDFGAGTPFPCEDVGLACRASLAGFEVRYDPALVVSHHHGRKPGPDIARLERQYAYGRGAYYAKFLLNRQSRAMFAKNLYWRWLDRQYRADAGTRGRELLGALRFLWVAARRIGGDPHRIATPSVTRSTADQRPDAGDDLHARPVGGDRHGKRGGDAVR